MTTKQTPADMPVNVLDVMDRAASGLSAAIGFLPADVIRARAAVAELLEAGNRVTAAFRALGVTDASKYVETVRNRQECEAAMLALDTALANCKPEPALQPAGEGE